jgi:hypothetical protein
VKSCYFALTVFFDDFRFYYERNPVIPAGFSCFESEHGEASRKTRYTSKDGFESFGEMMGDEIFKDLDSRNPRLPLVSYPSLPANSHDHLIMVHAIHKISERIREHFGIRVHLRSWVNITERKIS